MGDDEKTTNVSNKDIENVEKEVQAKQKAEVESIKKETEERVRKELSSEQELAALKSAKEELEKKLATQEEEGKKLKSEQEAAINKLVQSKVDEEMVKRKAVVASDSPFDKPGVDAAAELKNMSPERLREIEERSRAAFDEKHGIRG